MCKFTKFYIFFVILPLNEAYFFSFFIFLIVYTKLKKIQLCHNWELDKLLLRVYSIFPNHYAFCRLFSIWYISIVCLVWLNRLVGFQNFSILIYHKKKYSVRKVLLHATLRFGFVYKAKVGLFLLCTPENLLQTILTSA